MASAADQISALYSEYWDYVVNLCRRFVHTQDAAEDLAQDTFVRILQNERLERFEGRSAIRTWLHRVAVNVCLYHLRRANHQGEHVSADVLESSGRAPDLTAGMMVKDALDSLRPCEAPVVELMLQGFTHEEIAVKLNISVGASKSFLSRSRDRMYRATIAEARPRRKAASAQSSSDAAA